MTFIHDTLNTSISAGHATRRVAMTLLAGALVSALGIMPVFAQPSVRSLVVSIQTGADDLRGGAVSTAQLRLANGTVEPSINLNRGANWKKYSTNLVTLHLSRAYAPSELANAQLIINHDGAGRNFGESYDNWDVQGVTVRTPQVCSGGESLLGGNLVKRFTGKDVSGSVKFSVAKALVNTSVQTLILTTRTGRDDLRAGGVASAQIRLQDGRTLPIVNLNHGQSWQYNSAHTVSLALPAWVKLGQLDSIVITHDGAGRNIGETYDNWDVSAISVTLPNHCETMTLGTVNGNPWARFTGQNMSASVRLHTP